MIRKLFLIFVCMWLLCGCAGATDYYVSPTGTGNGLTIETAGDPSTLDTTLRAGDTMYFLPGTYVDKHIYVTYSGTESSYINLKKYNESVVFDGINKTGYGFQIRDEAYIIVDGLEFTNYSTGVYLEYGMHDLEFKNISLHDMEYSGFEPSSYSGKSVYNISMHDFVIYNAGDSNEARTSGGIMIRNTPDSDDCYNLSFYNFSITPGELSSYGIMWSKARDINIWNGTIENSGSDGIYFGTRITNSTISHVDINDTHWHGICTKGGNQNAEGSLLLSETDFVRNVTISNCTIGYPGHNAIDVHTGNDQIYIRDCYFYGQNVASTGINYMWNGTSLYVDNVTVDGLLTGMYLYQENATVSNVTTRNLRSWACGIGRNNVTVKDSNLSSALTYAVLTQETCDNFVVENCTIEEGKNYWILVGDGIIRNPQNNLYSITCDTGSYANVEYANGRVFKPNVGTVVFAPTGSSFNSTATRTITAYNYSAVPAAETATITPNIPTGSEECNFTANSTNGNLVTFAVWDLTPGYQYSIEEDGVQKSTQIANATGYITWNNDAWSEHVYTVEDTGLRLPVCAFTANATDGTAPKTIQFTDASTQSPETWSWDFNGDDVEDSTDQNPVWTYDTAGSYDVSLTVTNAIGSDTEEKIDYIILTNPYVAPIILTTVAAALLFMRARRRW